MRAYDAPVADPLAERPVLRWSPRGVGRARTTAGRIRRRVRGQRLAYLDSHFPWERSGFRYADAHALLYPGGGLLNSNESLDRVGRLVDAADQVFSYVPQALHRFPQITPIDVAIIDTGFYVETPIDLHADPVRLLFAADAKPRKGLDVALAAQRLVDTSHRVHLVVAGPNEPSARDAGRSAEFVGWQSRDELRTLHARTSIFASGSARVRERLDVRAGALRRLALMGL